LTEHATSKKKEKSDLGCFMDRQSGGDRYYNLSADGVFHYSVFGIVDFESHAREGNFFNPSSDADNEPRSYLRMLFERTKEL
jgi:hypothetical protein